MSQRTTLAKLTPPRLYAVTPRQRLFSLVTERCRDHTLVWITGPPGAGKTSLIASYLAEHKPRTLWYHVDPGDADLATFFHYLALVAQGAVGRKRLRLPALTAEYLADVPGFTRRFMREVWSKVPVPAVLVLDNYQELPLEAGLHALVPIMLTESPPGATLIAISRNEPPTELVQSLIHQSVGYLGWEDLRLTFDEAQAIAKAVPGLDQAALQTLHAQANGWVAGTVLLLERYKAKAMWPTPSPTDTVAEVFPYFANQVFASMNARTQTILMRTALLPWVTAAMAAEMSDDAGAGQVLHELYRRGLFVNRRTDHQAAYQYHDLFREFLLRQCHEHVRGETLQSHKRIAAEVAEQYELQDAAIALYAEIQAWDDLSRIICDMSERWLAQGRYQTLQGYIAQLPQSDRQQRPWVLYWSGMSRVVFDPPAARADFEAAYQQFEATKQNLAGLLLSGSGIIQTYYCSMDDMSPTIPWGDRLHRLLSEHKEFSLPAIEAKVMTNLQGLIFACPSHPLIRELEEAVDRILHSLDNIAGRLGVALVFTGLQLWRGDFSQVRHTIDNLNRSLKGAPIPPSSLLVWMVNEASYYWNMGDRRQAKEKLHEALSLTETFGLLVFMPLVWAIQIYNALGAGDDQDAESLVHPLGMATQAHQRLVHGQISYFRAGIALIRGDLQSALVHASQSVSITESLCIPFLTGCCRVGLAKVLVELEEREQAIEHLTLALEGARQIPSRVTEVHCLVTMAQLFLKDGQLQEANEALEKGLRIARELGFTTLENWWRPKVMGELLAHALEADIEVEYVRSVIRRRGLCAPAAALKHWPYPVTIQTLGRFTAKINDTDLVFSGKIQRKPLDLLKYLCAAGPHGSHQELIQETLWPNADGEAAEQAFRTTLHRLRKLLCLDAAVRYADRHVSLDPSLVSSDHLAFEQSAQPVDRTNVMAIERVLGLYHGHFLQGETAPWILPVRERLRARFLDVTERLGLLLEEQGEADRAAQRYLHALNIEPAAEQMCRRVMIIYGKLGRRAEAQDVYQRFTHALQTKLGVPPSPETVSVYQQITTI